uniref:Secreted protein n=1 Tax=Sphaeramia orbicularis TaxID=375764 RepID=A0A673BY44_9TELE
MHLQFWILWCRMCLCMWMCGCTDVLLADKSPCGCLCFRQQLLYTFDKQVCVSSCSLNKEETLLVSKCLTLLIEIHPINNTKVLKAVDCRVKVQVQCAYTACVLFWSHLLVLPQPPADNAIMEHRN